MRDNNSRSGPLTMENTMQRLSGAPDPMTDEQQRLHDVIASGPRGRVRGPLAMWLHSPALAERAQSLGEHLRFNNVFPKKLSEMVIIMTAAHHRCDFEWVVHEAIARDNGLPDAHIAAIRAGQRPKDMADDQAALYDFVNGLLADNRVTDDVYASFAGQFGNVGIVEATALIGYYQIGAHLLNATEFRPDDETSAFGRDAG